MIPILTSAGHRVIAPDLVGFGKSDKPAYKSDYSYQMQVDIMPYLVPSQLRENADAWEVLERWNKPFLIAFSDSDPVTKGYDREFLRRVPGALNVTVRGAGHFVQEDTGVALANLIVSFMAGGELPSSIE